MQIPNQFRITSSSGNVMVHVAKQTGEDEFQTLCGRYDILDLDVEMEEAVFDTESAESCGVCKRVLLKLYVPA